MFIPTTTSNPRYFLYSLISRTPRKFRISSFVSLATTLKKKMVVLSQLICYHEACSYTAKKRDCLAYLSSQFAPSSDHCIFYVHVFPSLVQHVGHCLRVVLVDRE